MNEQDDEMNNNMISKENNIDNEEYNDEDILNENQTLLGKKISNSDKKEKQHLIQILKDLEKKLSEIENENKTIDQVYEDYVNNDDTVKNNILVAIKDNWENKMYKFLLHFMFLIVLPAFTILNLIGIFQMLSVMNFLYDAIKNSILSFFIKDEEEDKAFYNFYGFYIKGSLDEGIDFDLMETMGFLGTILLNYSGFTATSIFCLVINCVSLFLILNFYNQYNPALEKYNFFQILYLCICYVLLFVGVGSSALLSQQILIDSYFKYKTFLKEREDDKKEDKDKKKELVNIENNEENIINNSENIEEENKKKDDEKDNEDNEDKEDKKGVSYFVLICITTILGFFGKYSFNIYIANEKYEFDLKYNLTDNSENNTFFNNNTDFNKNETEINNIIFSHDKKLFYYYIMPFYVICIIMSILVYLIFGCIFEKEESEDEEEQGNQYRICQICGYTIYSQNILDPFKKNKKIKSSDKEPKSETTNLPGVTDLRDTSNNKNILKNYDYKPKKNVFQKILGTCTYYLNLFCECIKLLCNSFKNCCDEIICGYFCCGKKDAKCCCCCCCNCCEVKEEDYEQKEQFFCYCYQGKRKQKWFNKFIRDETQKKLIPLMLEYFILQLTIIGFEKNYNDNNEKVEFDNLNDKNNINLFIGIFILSLLLFFYLTVSFGEIFIYLSKKDGLIKGMVESISNKILNGTYGIIIFNGFYSFTFSLLFLLKGKENFNINYAFVPIFMNKFYFFTFAHHCTIFTDEAEGLDLISCSTLISIYLTIWDFIIGFITDKLSLNALFIIQLAVSAFIILISLFILSLLLFSIGYFWLSFLYLLSFLFSFGGCWFCKCYEKHNCENYQCCKDHQDTCFNHKWLYLIFGKRNLTNFMRKVTED